MGKLTADEEVARRVILIAEQEKARREKNAGTVATDTDFDLAEQQARHLDSQALRTELVAGLNEGTPTEIAEAQRELIRNGHQPQGSSVVQQQFIPAALGVGKPKKLDGTFEDIPDHQASIIGGNSRAVHQILKQIAEETGKETIIVSEGKTPQGKRQIFINLALGNNYIVPLEKAGAQYMNAKGEVVKIDRASKFMKPFVG
ncbi:MAG: hypothetical protein J0L77_02015 [Alphaproteobacteria bacterium]|nr:hypothetical protein [Alphaproteobacteria bacterium]